MTLLDNLPHTAAIRKRSIVQDDYLGETETYVNSTTGLSVWVQPASQKEIDEFQRKDISVTHKVYFNTDPTAYFDDEEANAGEYEILPSTGPMANQSLEVRSHAEATAGVGWGWKVMCEFLPGRDLT
jgi:hypothetical protein